MRLFGTDGVRGLANGETLTASLALDLAVSAAQVLAAAGQFEGHRPVAVIGRDPRVSGQFLEAAVSAGLASAGVDVLELGVVPTPGIAFLTGSLEADLGVVITASHNPMPDNGIKFLARGGVKLGDALEEAIEARLGQPWTHPTGADVGRIGAYHGAIDDYVDHLLASLPHRLDGLTVVLDCAHGAAHESAPLAFEQAGARVIPLHHQPNGLNINDGVGSTHMESLRKAVLEHGADVGFAFDGDADRCLAVDAAGDIVDGDQIMGILALAMHESGRLHRDTLVTTVMSNIGLHQAMRTAGITVRTTGVGDRYVLEDMNAGHYSLGGEQSGHIIMSDYATTGDGTLTALHLAARMAATGIDMASLACCVVRSPQVLVNVGGVDRSRCTTDLAVATAVQEAVAELGDAGRVLLRPSGTEPLVRVMVEAPTEAGAREIADRLAAIVAEHLAL